MNLQIDRSGPTLVLASAGGGDPEGRLCLIARTGVKAVTEKNVESELACSIVVGSAVDAFRALLTEIYLPSLASWESLDTGSQRSLDEFMQVIQMLLLGRNSTCKFYLKDQKR